MRNSEPTKGKVFYHLRTKGIWVFFSPAGSVETIRIDAPFAGPVDGIHLGDSAAVLTSRLGKPITNERSAFVDPSGKPLQAYHYALDDTAYISFHVQDDYGVKIILIHR